MDTRTLVDPALLTVLDAMPTVALSDALLGPLRDAERFAQLPVVIPPEADAAMDVGSGLLATLGRPVRQSACECERVGQPSLGQSLFLVPQHPSW